MINQDLNEGSEGKFIYGEKVWTQNASDAITGWAFVQNNNAVPSGAHKINQDLNEGAGGSYNYLCYFKGGDRRVTDITFLSFGDAFKDSIYNGWQVYPQDLNTGTKKTGRYIYLAYQTN